MSVPNNWPLKTIGPDIVVSCESWLAEGIRPSRRDGGSAAEREPLCTLDLTAHTVNHLEPGFMIGF